MKMRGISAVLGFLAIAVACSGAQNPSRGHAKEVERAYPTNSSEGGKLQPFDVKTGLWETTTSYTIAGGIPMPPGMMDKMTTEQRARYEQAMKNNSARPIRTNTEKHCVTAQDLEKPVNFSEQCKWNLTESTSKKAKGDVTCEDEGMRMTGSGEFDAVDREHITGFTHGTAAAGGRTMNVDTKLTSTWLSASCGDVR
jgi:hypothetical protein